MRGSLKNIVSDVGLGVMFLGRILYTAKHSPCKRKDIFEQTWRVTQQGAVTTALAGFFVGAVMTVQFTMQVKGFGALGFLGGISTSATIREIGPLLIAFMLSGKIGAFTSAELGTMRVTEQIDAIKCLGANPIQEIVLPRFIGIVISSFFLLAIGMLMSIVGGLILGVLFSGISPEEYMRHVPTVVSWPSISLGLFKSFVFSLLIASVCTFKGYTAFGGAKGVGRAVINTAVGTMVGIVIADWLTSVVSEAVGVIIFY